MPGISVVKAHHQCLFNVLFVWPNKVLDRIRIESLTLSNTYHMLVLVLLL